MIRPRPVHLDDDAPSVCTDRLLALLLLLLD
jgi:hypothetical protein